MDDSTNEQSSPAPAAGHRSAGQPILGLDRRTPLMRVDLTINIPTIIAVLGSVIAIAGTGVTLYYSMDRRMLTSEFEIAKITKRIEDNERAVTNVRNDQLAQQNALRTEIKGDINEIKGMLNQIVFNGLPTGAPPQRQMQQSHQQQLNEWRK